MEMAVVFLIHGKPQPWSGADRPVKPYGETRCRRIDELAVDIGQCKVGECRPIQQIARSLDGIGLAR